MKQVWNIGYKVLAVGLVLYSITYGLLVKMPLMNALWGQSVRGILYHVPMWFAEIVLMTISVVFSIRVLRALDPDRKVRIDPLPLDIKAREAALVGILFNALGLATGIVWQRVTWGDSLPSDDFAAWWAWDPIQVCALVGMLIYLAYFLLRSSFSEPEQRARVGAVYNVFAFALLIPLFFVIPAMLDGLHPTSNGSEAGGGSFVAQGQVDNTVRMVLYPGMLGFILMGVWLWEVRYRLSLVRQRFEDWTADRTYAMENA
ncbi:MAG: cytochrome c biogenesis protein CcsA [Bacteroidota bacterium]